MELVQRNRVSHLVVCAATALLLLPGLGQAEAVKLNRHGNAIDVTIGGSPFTTYHFAPEYSKSFLQPLRDPHGIVITRPIPVGNVIPPEHEHDPGLEPHQRGLYFAHGDVDGNSFWVEEAFSKYYKHDPPMKFGRMIFRSLDQIQSGPSSAVIRATYDLEGSDKKPFAQETEEYKFSGDKDERVIDCEFVIKAGSQPVHFGDTKEGTFGIRLSPELNAPKGTMVNSEGGQGEKQIWGKRANWVDVDGVIDGQQLGVAVLDAPDSFRHPTYWHARGYGLLAANPFGLSYFLADPKQNGGYTLPARQTVKFRYRVLIHDGTYKDAHIAEKYTQYAAHK
jgi:Methane oxygenase PmoA